MMLAQATIALFNEFARDLARYFHIGKRAERDDKLLVHAGILLTSGSDLPANPAAAKNNVIIVKDRRLSRSNGFLRVV